MSAATVILFCGLPASGKSTSARKLSAACSEDYHVVHLEYDDFEDSVVLVQEQKERREAWNKAREEVVYRLQNILENRPHNKQLLVLMDDNFHLRGMRKQIHRFLLQFKPVNFGVIWMQASVDECIERNRRRPRKVPNEVIKKMSTTLELPRADWEKCWMLVNDATPFNEMIRFIKTCCAISDLPDLEDSKQQEEDREITKQSLIHSSDKILRSWVGLSAKHHKSLAQGANQARKTIMQLLRDQDPGLTDEESLLRRFVELTLSSTSSLGQTGVSFETLKTILQA